MEKQITTVYVPTDEAPYFVVKDVEKEFIKARVTEKEAYLYTPKEHAAVQGYREALEKILTKRIDELNAADVEFCKDRWERPEIHPLQKAMAREESNKVTFARQELQSILSKVQALSKAEDKGDVKKDFVQWLEEDGLPASRSILAELKALNAAKEATPQPTNSLDELERWAQKGMVKSTLGIIAGDKYTLGYNGALTDLLTKIQSLKQNPKP